MLVAHRIRLDPNNAQATHLARAAGTARFAYNWALGEWQKQYEACKADTTLPRPSEAALRRLLNSIKRDQFPWMMEVTKSAPQMAIMQLGRAFENFFAGRARYPRFRRKGQDDRFTLTNDLFRVEGRHIRIPKLGWVRMRETLRFAGRIVSTSVTRVADHWYTSITVDTSDSPVPPAENQGAVGVDLGIKALATLSNGETFQGPNALRSLLIRLQRLSRALSRKVKGSRNRAKAKLKLVKLHVRIANIRRDSLHKLSTSITRRFHTIGIEDLNVKGMLGNRHLARAIADMGFYELRRQLEYKAARRGGQVVLVDRWYPSSKLCSSCGYRLEALGLGVRHWTCPGCGASNDRDVNAAINLRNVAVSSTASACGGEGSGPVRKRRAKPAPAKQESDGRKLDHHTLQTMRQQAVKAVREGATPASLATAYGVSERTIYAWLSAFASGGQNALLAKPISGRPPKLGPDEMRWIARAVCDNSPQQFKFEFGLWTLSLIGELIKREFGKSLSLASVSRVMKLLGYSAQKPLYQAWQQDPALVRQWEAETYPAIKAQARAEGAMIYFADEAGIRSDYHTGTTWAPVGQTPVVTVTGRRFSFNMISAVSPRGDFRFMIHEGTATAKTFKEFLTRLMIGATQPVFVIVDGHPIHKSKLVRDYVATQEGRLKLFLLPPYSPHLNPDEQVWAHVKRQVSRKLVQNSDDMKKLVLGALRRIQKLPGLVKSFFRQPECQYAEI